MYCVNENKDTKAHFAFFFNISFCHSFITHIIHFLVYTATVTTRFRIMKLCVKLQLGKAYCVNEIKMLILILSIFSKLSIFLLSFLFNTGGSCS